MKFWLREITFLILGFGFFILIFALVPPEITNAHLTTENFKNLVFFILIGVACLKEYKGQKVSGDFYKIVWIIVGFYFGGVGIANTQSLQ